MKKTSEIAKELDCHQTTVYKAMHRHKIPHAYIGARLAIDDHSFAYLQWSSSYKRRKKKGLNNARREEGNS
jgi:hypothetical protein